MFEEDFEDLEAFEMDERGRALVAEVDGVNAAIGRAQRRFLALVAEVDRTEVWRADGARDTAHWLGIRYGVSSWKALRWVAAAHALEGLPETSSALERGELGLDKVVELARFATAETEAKLIAWAQEVSCGAIRRRAELLAKAARYEVEQPERNRFLDWWFSDEGRTLFLEGELPAAQGAVVARTLDRMARSVPLMPGEDEPCFASERRADALVALCSARLAQDPDPDRATVVVHARLEAIVDDGGGCEIEDGSVIHADTARRLLCNARVQTVIEDANGEVLGLGRMSREPSPWMLRQVRYRDGGCRFPGCGTRAFTEAHHIRWWRDGGRTDLDNLLLICSFHHRLVHEYGWRIRREPDGRVSWFRSDGTRYRAGPSPGASPPADEALISALSAAAG